MGDSIAGSALTGLRAALRRRVILAVVLSLVALAVPTPVSAAGGLRSEQSAEEGYSFLPIAFLGDTAPKGGQFVVDFEPYTMNARGDIAFAADLTTGGEGVFVWRAGEIVEIMRSGDPAPGGGTFEGGVWADTAVNTRGDVAFAFSLSPFSTPFGVNSGVFRFSSATQTLEPVVLPFITPAPDGSTFSGATFSTSMNDRGEIAFAGLIPTDEGIRIPGEEYVGLGSGVFMVDSRGSISSVAGPGTPAPGGGVFDFAGFPRLNDVGDVVFNGHVAGGECLHFDFLGFPQGVWINCFSGLYVWSRTEGVRAIVRPGDPAPGGGAFRWAERGKVNKRGDVAFFADLTSPPGVFERRGVFLHSGRSIVPIVRPGDPLPGGGSAATAKTRYDHDLNDRGEVTFQAILDTDDNEDGLRDTGQYLWSRGSVRLVLRTGTVITGVGTVAHVVEQDAVGTPTPFAGTILDNRGHVVSQVTLEDGRGVLLLATPNR